MSNGDIAGVGGSSLTQAPVVDEATFVTEDVFGGTWLEGGTSIANVTDMVDKVDALTKGGKRCLRKLILVSHGSDGQDGFVAFDAESAGTECIDGGVSSKLDPILNPTVTAQLKRLGKFMCPKGNIELRICRAGAGKKGTRAMQAIADATGVTVSAPMDKIKSIKFLGGLTVHWKAVYPRTTGLPPVESFWRDPEPPPHAAYVPVPGITPPAPAPPPVLPTPVGAPPAGPPPANSKSLPDPIALPGSAVGPIDSRPMTHAHEPGRPAPLPPVPGPAAPPRPPQPQPQPPPRITRPMPRPLLLGGVGLLVLVIAILGLASSVGRTAVPAASPLPTGSITRGLPAAAPQPLLMRHDDVFAHGEPCSGTATLRLHYEFANAPAGTPIVLELSGPGLPPGRLSQSVGADGQVTLEYPISGSGVWRSTVVSIAGNPAAGGPGVALSIQSSAQCAG